MYYVGCDQHKKYAYVMAKDGQGHTVHQKKLYHTDKEQLKAYFEGLPRDSVVALEACGFEEWLGDLVEDCGVSLKLVHAAKAKMIAHEKIKTDKMSASALADLMRLGLLTMVRAWVLLAIWLQ